MLSGIHDFYIGIKSTDEKHQSKGKKFKLPARWTGMLNLLPALIIAFMGVAVSGGEI